MGFLGDAVVTNPPANTGDRRLRFNPWVWKIPWNRKWQPTPVFLTGKSHGQRSLVGAWGHKKSDTVKGTRMAWHGWLHRNLQLALYTKSNPWYIHQISPSQVFLIFLNGNSVHIELKLNILRSFWLFLTPHIQFISKPCLFYLQDTSRLQLLLITCTATI